MTQPSPLDNLLQTTTLSRQSVLPASTSTTPLARVAATFLRKYSVGMSPLLAKPEPNLDYISMESASTGCVPGPIVAVSNLIQSLAAVVKWAETGGLIPKLAGLSELHGGRFEWPDVQPSVPT